MSKLMIAIILGFSIFFVGGMRKRNLFLEGFHLKSLRWLIPYFLGLGIISYVGNYGDGKALLPFGWDFLVIAIFSVVILVIATKMRLSNKSANQLFLRYQKETECASMGS